MLGIFSCFCFRLNVFKEYFKSVKQFVSRSRPTFCRANSGFKLFAKVIRVRQKSSLVEKDTMLYENTFLKVPFRLVLSYDE